MSGEQSTLLPKVSPGPIGKEQKPTITEVQRAPTGPEKRERVSLILNQLNTSKMDSVISIFGVEHFKLNSCLARNMESELCTGPTGATGIDSKAKVLLGATGSNPVNAEDAKDAKDAKDPEDPEDETLSQLSSYLGKNNAVIEQNAESYDYKTKKEFELLYLPKSITKQEKKLILKLFRFIFGTKNSMIDQAILQKLITPFDKLPCNEGKQAPLLTLLKDCFTYRIEGGSDSIGLHKEITNLRGIIPHSQEYKSKYYLRAQILRMLEVLDERGRSCVIFSDNGGELFLSEYHTAILKLIRDTVQKLLHEKIPISDEEKDARLRELLKGIDTMTQDKGDNKKIFEEMLGIVKSLFDKMKTIDKDVDTLDEMLKVNTLFPPSVQAGGGNESESSAEAEAEAAEEEYDRVYTTAMGHLDGIPKGRRNEFLDEVYDVLGGKDLESSIEHTVQRKGFSLSTTMSRLNEIPADKHGESFIRCIKTLLELKESQMKAYDSPPNLPPKERYSYTLSKYTSLKDYIPKDILVRGSLEDLEKKLRRIYPYTETLIQDIKAVRKTPDPCSLFYKGLLIMMPEVRSVCKNLINSIPRCKELLEEVLVACEVPLSDGLMFREVTIPKGFWAMADGLRKIPAPGLPITIHEEPPKKFQKVMGDRSFLLIGSGTLLTGIKDFEIDVSDDIDEIRKGEVSLGAVLFLYLYIMCDSHIDA